MYFKPVLEGFHRHTNIHGEGGGIFVGVFLRVIFEGVTVGGLVAAVGHPAADSIPGFAKLVGFDFEASYRAFASG